MKKQIAVLMAAATAVTTVAPVIANAGVKTYSNTSVSEANAVIMKALNTRYKDAKQNGVDEKDSTKIKDYANSQFAVFVKVNVAIPDADLENYGLLKKDASIYENNTFEGVPKEAGDNVYVVENASKVSKLVEGNTIANNPFSVYIVDKGVKDGSSTYATTNKHYVDKVSDADTEVSLMDFENTLVTKKQEAKTFVDDVKKDDDGTVILKLKSGKELKFKVNDEAIDLEKPVTKDNQELSLENADQSVYDQVEGFKLQENKDKKSVDVDIPNGDTTVYNVIDVAKTDIEVSTIYSKDNGYTQAGADLLNALIKAKKDNKMGYAFNYMGVNYMLAKRDDKTGDLVAVTTDAKTAKANAMAAVHTDTAVIEAMGDHYVLKVNVDVIDKNDKGRFKTIQFAIDGKTQKDLQRVLNDLKGNNEVVVGKFNKLAGIDRYATAIEVSKERFEYHEADSVVIVGAEALMDGLSAAPLASAKNAPVLLSSKSGLDKNTLEEVDRVCKDLKNKTVYIVGGVNSVPEKVEKQLEEKGAVVVRLAGQDRYDTSYEVALRLNIDKEANATAYVVGGEGAADAMSISAVAATKDAANKVSPILVVNKDGINRNTRNYAKEFGKSYVIGGEATVGTQVIKDLRNTNPTRIAGTDRFDTNVEIIKTFYGNSPKIMAEGLAIASGKNQYLVDAQTAGAFAAEKKAAVLLTDMKLTKDQEKLLDDGVLSKIKTNVYQVGGIVSSDAMKTVVDTLGL